MKVYRVSRQTVSKQSVVAYFVMPLDADDYAQEYVEGDFTTALIDEVEIEERE